MALQGNLEDLPLLDIVQIVSFSKKTGYLSIAMEGGEGAIVFREGLVVSAFTAGSPPADPRLATLGSDAREKAARGRIGFALEQLARLREGAFGFELTVDVPPTVGGRDIRLETLDRGINPQEMLLDLAQGLDDGRAESAAAVEASFAAPEEGVVGEEPIVPSGALATDMGASAEGEAEPGPGQAAEAAAGQWQASPPERYTSDTQPLPRVVFAAPPAVGEPPVEAVAPVTTDPVPSPAESARIVLLVDDEPDVRGILARHFAAGGFRVAEAGDPEEAAKAAGRLREQQVPFVLVTDLGMPASGGASFHGGFEVVKRIWKMNLRPPVLMMTESLSQSLRLRARQMGVQAFVFKPTLSKLNPKQFEADISAFAGKLVADVLPRLAERALVRPAAGPRKAAAPKDAAERAEAPGESRSFDLLRRRLVELRQGGDANEIATLVMKVARESFERAILFVVKNDEARGLGGFGLAPREETLNILARQIAIPLGEPSVFHEVARSLRTFAGPPPADRWLGHLMGRIGRFQSRGIAVFPLAAHRETIALVFGDNPETGRDPAGLEAFEVLVQQAGIALENVFLHKKLQALGDKERAPLR